MSVPIARGTNISHWLSQSEKRGQARRDWFTRADVARIAAWGFDHIRLPVDEDQLWDTQGQPESEAWDLLDAALDWAQAEGLGAVVDLHILRGHHFNQQGEPALFADPAAAAHFTGLWRQLSARLRRRSVDRVAYELLNEAVASDPADWNRVALGAHAAVRTLEPQRSLVLGSNRWNSVFTYDDLQVPTDPATILTFHYYHPMLLTHYRANWWRDGAGYDGPVRYPGKPVAEADLPRLRAARTPVFTDDELVTLNAPYDAGRIRADLAQPLAKQRATGLPLYCGEFGVYDRAPRGPRLAWYGDAVRVFSELGIGWANWDYKGGFALVGPDGGSTGIAEVMLAAAGVHA